MPRTKDVPADQPAPEIPAVGGSRTLDALEAMATRPAAADASLRPDGEAPARVGQPAGAVADPTDEQVGEFVRGVISDVEANVKKGQLP